MLFHVTTSSECRGCTASTHPSTEGAVLLFPGRSCKSGGTSWWSSKGPWTTASGSRWVSSRTPSPRSPGWTKGSSPTNHPTSQDAVLFLFNVASSFSQSSESGWSVAHTALPSFQGAFKQFPLQNRAIVWIKGIFINSISQSSSCCLIHPPLTY